MSTTSRFAGPEGAPSSEQRQRVALAVALGMALQPGRFGSFLQSSLEARMPYDRHSSLSWQMGRCEAPVRSQPHGPRGTVYTRCKVRKKTHRELVHIPGCFAHALPAGTVPSFVTVASKYSRSPPTPPQRRDDLPEIERCTLKAFLRDLSLGGAQPVCAVATLCQPDRAG